MADVNRQGNGRDSFDSLKAEHIQFQTENHRAYYRARGVYNSYFIKKKKRRAKWHLLAADFCHIFFITGLLYVLFLRLFIGGFWVGTFLFPILPLAILGGCLLICLILGIVYFVQKKKYCVSNPFPSYIGLLFIVGLILGTSSIFQGSFSYLLPLGVLIIFLLLLIPLKKQHHRKPKGIGYRLFACFMPLISFFLLIGLNCFCVGSLNKKITFDLRGSCYAENSYGETELDFVMLSAGDIFHIPFKQDFVVKEKVTLDKAEREVTAIGENAFTGVHSFSRVVLPATVTHIHKDAFADSDIRYLTVCSTTLHIDDGFISSSLREIYLPNAELTTFSFDEGAQIKDDLIFRVQENVIDYFRQAHPAFADRFEPILNDDQLYVNFNITSPADSGLNEYIPTVIANKDEHGTISVTLPYADKKDENEQNGAHFVHKQGDKTYRLFAFTANGESLDAENGFITTDTSLNIYGEWIEMYSLYADYSSDGGEKVYLGEIHELLGDFSLPTGITLPTKDGYVCNAWLTDPNANEEPITVIENATSSLTIYPKWSLTAPTITEITIQEIGAFGVLGTTTMESTESDFGHITREYNGYDYTIAVNAEHLLKADCTISCAWYKNDEIVSLEEQLTVKEISDSGEYTAVVTITDKDGNSAFVSQIVNIEITPADKTASE